MYDVTIIGAGIIGTFIARELSRYNLSIALIERDNDVGNGTTKGNTALIHSGYNARHNSLMAKLCVKGNSMFDKISKELDIEFKRVGSLVIAFNDEEMEKIKYLYENGIKNGVEKLEILNKEEILNLENNINTEVVGGLFAPSAGILSPWELTIALAENSVNNGVNLMLNNKVIDIKKYSDYFTIVTNRKEITSRYVINCAGLFSDEINNLVSQNKFNIIPRKGEYYILDKNAGDIVKRIVFQAPSKMGKGVVVAPTIHGNIIIGPSAEDTYLKDSLGTSRKGLTTIRESALRTIPNIPFNKVIASFSGLRAQGHIDDFYIGESEDVKGFINVAGIKSPGLTASPAIAEYVVKLLKEIDGNIVERKYFNPYRKGIIIFNKLKDIEKNKIIELDCRYGNIVCRCEGITEGEIVDCINRNVGARTVDGVKRRVRPGSGRCQGGFCQSRVIKILSRELGEPFENILKDNLGSYITIGKTKKGDNNERV